MDATTTEGVLNLAPVISAGAFGRNPVGSLSARIDFDLCRMGRPLPDSIYHKTDIFRMGLSLPRGPDPRSYNSDLATLAETGRSMLGLKM